MKLSEIAMGAIKVLKTEKSFSIVSRNIAVWPHLSLLCVLLKSRNYNKKGGVTWIVNLYASSVCSAEVN